MTFALAGLSPFGAAAQDDKRIIALVVSSGTAPDTADRVAESLGRIDAETLRSIDPTNAGLRALMRRFASEAEQSAAAIVVLDMPMVAFQDRPFVLPNEAELGRATDLFTEAVPLQAFARMTALSELGGAVILIANEPAAALPDSVVSSTTAPPPVAGASEILVAEAGQSAEMRDLIDRVTADPVRVDLANLLERLAELDGTSLSATPPQPILVKEPILVGAPPAPVVTVAAAPSPAQESREQAPETPVQLSEGTTEAPTQETAEAPAPSPEELEVLERSLSPAVKRKLQRGLRGLGHYGGLIDGIIGPQTREAITLFQASRTELETGFLTPGQLSELLALG